MLIHLIIKDFRAYSKFLIFSIFLPGIIWATIAAVQFSQWNLYLMFCNLTIIAAGSYYTFSEKKQNIQTLICSLPSTRTQIVVSKYLTTGIIVIIGIIFFSLITYITSYIFIDIDLILEKLFRIKIGFISLFLFTIFFSIFLPATFFLRISGMVITMATALFVSVYSYVVFFRPYRNSFTHNFIPDDIWRILLISFLIIFSMFLSIGISIKLFSKKNL